MIKIPAFTEVGARWLKISWSNCYVLAFWLPDGWEISQIDFSIMSPEKKNMIIPTLRKKNLNKHTKKLYPLHVSIFSKITFESSPTFHQIPGQEIDILIP